MTTFSIEQHKVGRGSPCFVIAEAGINHNGSLDMALALVKAASDAGCHAVKFQTYLIDVLAAADAPMADYQKANTGLSGSQSDLLKSCELDRAAHEVLIRECRRLGITFLSTPFDDPSLDLLADLGVPALKISSGDVTNTPFLQRASGLGVPVILSTGMATMEEVAGAATALRSAPFALLHCVSSYPADPADCNLPAMRQLEEAFHVPVGFSDHTTGFDVTLAAVALGASILEKHITLDRSLPGPDHAASLEPAELSAMMDSLRRVEAAVVAREKRPSAGELGTAAVARKSLHFRRDLPAGSILCEEDLAAMRPGTGISPSRRAMVVGRRLSRDVRAGAMVAEDMLL